MRPDLNKLLCERERPQSKNRFRDVRHSKHIKEFEGKMLTHGLAFGYDKKIFNENLSPLRRYLKANVGRLWDDIYSELCSVLDKRKTIDAHVFIHLYQDVETKTDFREGKVVYMNDFSHRGNRGWRPIEESYSLMYVHPVTGILSLVSKGEKRSYWRDYNKKEADKKALTQRDIEGRHYEKLLRGELNEKGCWFDVVIDKNTVSWTDLKGVRHTRIDEVRTQRQLNSKELKKLGLKND